MDFVLPRAPLVTGRIAAAGDWSQRFDDGEDTFAEEELVVDAAGRFAIFAPVADRPLRLTITDRPRVIVVEGIRGDTDLGDLEPAPLHDLSGRVLDPDGAPLAGARVELHSPWAWRVARTGTDGGFRLPESPRLAAWLRIQAPGYPDAWRLTEGGDLRLDRGGQVIGRLLDRDGRSAHFILISFRRCTAQGEPAGSEYWDTSPDSIGRFRVLLPPGRFRARSIGPGYTGGRAPGPIVEITEGARTEIEFRLPWSLPAWR